MAWYVGISRLDVDTGSIVLPAEDAFEAEVVKYLFLDLLFENGSTG